MTTFKSAIRARDVIPGLAVLMTFSLLFCGLSFASAQAGGGPTAANALAANEALARAIRENDASGILHWLDEGWAVISTAGGVGEGASIFPEGIRSGYLTRRIFEISDPRVRLYGDTALVTSTVHTAGMLRGKPFDVIERQTDVLLWKDGRWRCVLTQETKVQSHSAHRLSRPLPRLGGLDGRAASATL